MFGFCSCGLERHESIFCTVNMKMFISRLSQADQLLGNMIEMWVDRMDNITQPERRKLSALALLSLLPSENRFVILQTLQLLPVTFACRSLRLVYSIRPESSTNSKTSTNDLTFYFKKQRYATSLSTPVGISWVGRRMSAMLPLSCLVTRRDYVSCY